MFNINEIFFGHIMCEITCGQTVHVRLMSIGRESTMYHGMNSL